MNKYVKFTGICQSDQQESGVKENNENVKVLSNENPIQINSENVSIQNNEDDFPVDQFQNQFLDQIVQKLETLRQTDEEYFKQIINLNKELLIIINNYDGKESLVKVEEIYKEVEYPGYLYWSAIKALKIAILEIRDFELIHYFIVRQGIKLTDHTVKNIINEYFESLAEENFIENEDNEEILNYCNILHLLLVNGDAEIDCFDEKGVGNSILQTAIMNKQYQFILFVLNYTNVNINYVNKEIRTALDICFERMSDPVYEEIFHLLIPYGAESVFYKNKVKRYLDTK
jgi:hypothetical protein